MIVVCVRVSNNTTYGLTTGNHYEVIDSSDSNRLSLINDFGIEAYYDTFIDSSYEITDGTGKVRLLAEVSDYNIIYVGGLTRYLTYGKTYSILKLNNHDVSSLYFYIINDSGYMFGKRKKDNLFIEITKIREEKINSILE
jgi:hypothetical protein